MTYLAYLKSLLYTHALTTLLWLKDMKYRVLISVSIRNFHRLYRLSKNLGSSYTLNKNVPCFAHLSAWQCSHSVKLSALSADQAQVLTDCAGHLNSNLAILIMLIPPNIRALTAPRRAFEVQQHEQLICIVIIACANIFFIREPSPQCS